MVSDIDPLKERAGEVGGAVVLSERPQHRRPRQRDAERGLPSLDDRVKLARAYLAAQSRLWPSLGQTALLPSPDDTPAITAMGRRLRAKKRAARWRGDVRVHPRRAAAAAAEERFQFRRQKENNMIFVLLGVKRTRCFQS